MALRAVPDHPKFSELKATLRQPKGSVMGWLETMWHFTGRFTPQGNIGKYSDVAIEAWVEWDGEPGALIAAFIKTGWIDEDPVHRLLVHDWQQHADKATKNSLVRMKMDFCTPAVRTRKTRCTYKKPESSTAYPLPVPEPVPVPEPESKATPRKSVSVIPEWVPSDSWDGFVEMRKKIRAPLTERATSETIRSLEKLAKLGHDPGAVLDQSTQRGWRGIFGISNGGNDASNQANRFGTKTDRNREAARRAYDEIIAESADGISGGSANDSEPRRAEAIHAAPVILPPERRESDTAKNQPRATR